VLHYPELAIQDYSAAIEPAPDDPLGYILRGDALVDSGNPARASRDMTRVIQLTPNSASAWLKRGGARLKQERYSDAVDDVSEAIELQPTDLASYIIRRSIYVELGRFEEAIADASKAIELAPQHFTLWLTRAELKLEQDDTNGAVADVEQALKLSDDSLAVKERWARTLLAAERYAEAETVFTELIDAAPQVVEGLVLRGYARQRQQKYDLALSDFDEAVIEGTVNPLALIGRGDIQYHKGDYASALKSYDRALDLEADFSPLLVRFAWILATCPQAELLDGTVAQALAQRGASISGNTLPNALEAHAAALAEQGKYQEASNLQEKAIKLYKLDSPFIDWAKAALADYASGTPHRETAEERTVRSKSFVAESLFE